MLNHSPGRALAICFLAVGFAVGLPSCASILRYHQTPAVEVIKSPNDSRAYRYLQLPNRLKVLLISDADAERAAASLDVQVGNRHDPDGYNGLAHFLEHMLFLGTSKYPSADEYQQFIGQHGGSHNAYTSFENTNYFFDINNPHLDAALDRFADFFIAPSFDAAYIERERNAIESEFRARYANESRRILDATREIVNPAHPFAKFTTGNLQTLSQADLRDRLLAFHQAHYSSSRMSLAVSGAYSLDQLEAMVRDRFAAIGNNGSTTEPVAVPLFDGKDRIDGKDSAVLPTLLAVRTLKPLRQLHLTFPLPDIKPFSASKPLEYIGNILGHEGKRSLLSILKQAGLAESISAGVGMEYTGGALYQLKLVLTANGLHAVDEVVALVMRAIAATRLELEQNPAAAQQRFVEQRRLADMAFRFSEHGAPTGTVISASSNLQYFAPHKVLYGAYEFADFDAALINRVLQRMTPANMLLTLASNELPETLAPTRESRWYHTAYSVTAVGGEPSDGWGSVWRERWRAALAGESATPGAATGFATPGSNPFIATDFTLFAGDAAVDGPPQLVAREAGFELWRKIDDKFEVPKLDLRVAFLSDYNAVSARRQVLANLYALVAAEQLKEFIYPAYLAGMQASFYPTLRGYTLRVGGYNHGVAPLLREILQALSELTVSEQRFGELSAELERKWQLAMQASPATRLGSFLSSELYVHSSDYPALIAVLRELQYSDLKAFAAGFWPTTYVQALLHGNLDAAQTGALQDLLAGGVLPRCACQPQARQGVAIRHLPPGLSRAQLTLPHSDKAIVWYFQAGDDALRSAALSMLSADILHPPLFNQLRTEAQLGYIVSASYYALYKLPGLSLTLQSPQHSETVLAGAVEEFIAGFIAQPPSAEVFARHRDALISKLGEADPNLRARSGRYWRSLMFNIESFDYREQLARELAGIDYASWRRHLPALLGEDGRSLRVSTQTPPP